MTIYVVTRGEYSDYQIEAVFLERKKAEIFCAVHGIDYEIEEFETKDDAVDSAVETGDKWIINTGPYEEPTSWTVGHGLMNEPVKIERRISFSGKEWYKITLTVPSGTSQEAVFKIANDKLAEWKYEQMVERAKEG